VIILRYKNVHAHTVMSTLTAIVVYSNLRVRCKEAVFIAAAQHIRI